VSTCPSCGAADQPAGAHFCHQCGSALESTCVVCSAVLAPGARFCSQCGSPASVGAERPAAAPPGVGTTPASAAGAAPAFGAGGGAVAERRVTSVLFCDLVGFTTLSETRDHEETRELLTQYFDDARRIVGRYGGTVEKFIGDAVMAVWGVPTAHEDDAERAVRAGLELVTRVSDMGGDLGLDGLSARVGVVTGEVAVTLGAQQQGMVAGDAVNTASRVQSVAAPGEVWVDETTRLLSSGAITYSDAGSHQLKGKADPVPLWTARAVVAARGGAQRADGLEAPLIGRERELRLVKELFHGVEMSRRPALLLVDGESGVGKSRLGWEFEKYVDGLDTSVKWHTGRCLAYGEGVAFWAIAEAVRGRLSAAGEDPDRETNQLLDETFQRYGITGDERDWMRPRLEVLLGTAPHRFAKEDLFAAWTTFFERVGEGAHPVVLVIDDAQYAEDGLLDFVEHLLTWAGFPLLVLLMTRPGLLERRVSLVTHRNSTVIHLPGLDEPNMARLLDGLVSGLPEEARGELVARAEGIPLYAVETVRSLIDRDLVVPRGGVYVLATNDVLDLASIAAPPSLQALLAARLDALTADQRRVVSVASVLGTTLSRDRIAGLCPEVEDIDDVLAQLVHLQIVAHQSSRLSSEFGRYSFQQSMFRQVAYATLSLRERKKIHLRIVESYGPAEDLSPDHASVLARHLLDAIDALPTDDDVPSLRAQAIGLLSGAAERARSLGLPEEAADHLREALGNEDDPVRQASLRSTLATVLLDTSEYDEAVTQAQQATEVFDAVGDERAAGLAAAIWANALALMNRLDEAAAVARPRWERLKSDPEATTAGLALSQALILSKPNLRWDAEAVELLDVRARLADKAADAAALADTFTWMSLRHLFTGASTLGMTLLQATATLAREHQLPDPLARAPTNLTAFAITDDAAKAVELGREALTVGRRSGVLRRASNSGLNLAVALLVRGEWRELRALLESTDMPWEKGLDENALRTIEVLFSLATGDPLTRPAPDPSDVEGMEGADLAWIHFGEAALLTLAGSADEALSMAMTAVEGYGELYDDFLHMWALAAELALTTGDRSAEERLLELVDSATLALPLGLRAHRAHVGALLAVREEGRSPAGASPDGETLLRRAAELYAEWGALPYRAKVLGELGSYLARLGRQDEAEPLLQESREYLTSIGAHAWLEQLHLSPAAVHSS
jgi:class 3 adenylate cyclase